MPGQAVILWRQRFVAGRDAAAAAAAALGWTAGRELET